MDKTTAQRIVRDTFKAPFDRKRYRDFINELCNGIDESKAISSMAVPDAFAPHIKSCQRLGTFQSPDGELTDVLVVHLTESFKLERTRTALRDFVAHKVGQKMRAILKSKDYEALPYPGDQPRWRNRVQWARNVMVNEDDRMKKGSPRGIWEISNAGRAWLKKQ